jgi:amino-acid N-acetyltransferase
MESLESEAVANGLGSVFAFTYVPDFFGKLGFVEVDRHQLPSKVWKDCLRCPKLQCCDEIAMQKMLVSVDAPPLWGDAAGVELNYNGALILPVVRK